MLPLVSGSEVSHVLRRCISEAEEDIAARSVSSCTTVLSPDLIPIRVMEGRAAAEGGVLLHGQP